MFCVQMASLRVTVDALGLPVGKLLLLIEVCNTMYTTQNLKVYPFYMFNCLGRGVFMSYRWHPTRKKCATWDYVNYSALLWQKCFYGFRQGKVCDMESWKLFIIALGRSVFMSYRWHPTLKYGVTWDWGNYSAPILKIFMFVYTLQTSTPIHHITPSNIFINTH